MEHGLWLLLLVAAALGLRLIAGALDGSRIDGYFRERGGRVVSRHWSPFGRGWFGERSDRIYEVVYEDRHGQRRRATVKTSMFTGVYLTEDRAVHRRADAAAAQGDEVQTLRAENARLKAELTRRR